MIYSSQRFFSKKNTKKKQFVKAYPPKSHKEDVYGGSARQELVALLGTVEGAKASKKDIAPSVVEPTSVAVSPEDAIWDEILNQAVLDSKI